MNESSCPICNGSRWMTCESCAGVGRTGGLLGFFASKCKSCSGSGMATCIGCWAEPDQGAQDLDGSQLKMADHSDPPASGASTSAGPAHRGLFEDIERVVSLMMPVSEKELILALQGHASTTSFGTFEDFEISLRSMAIPAARTNWTRTLEWPDAIRRSNGVADGCLGTGKEWMALVGYNAAEILETRSGKTITNLDIGSPLERPKVAYCASMDRLVICDSKETDENWGVLHIFDSAGWKEVGVPVPVHPPPDGPKAGTYDSISFLKVRPGTSEVAVTVFDWTQIFDLASGRLLRHWKSSIDWEKYVHIGAMAFDTAGDLLATAYHTATVEVRDVATGELKHRLQNPTPGAGSLESLVWLRGTDKLLVAGDGLLTLWDASEGTLVWSVRGSATHDRDHRAVVMDSNLLVEAGLTSELGTLGKLWLWELDQAVGTATGTKVAATEPGPDVRCGLCSAPQRLSDLWVWSWRNVTDPAKPVLVIDFKGAYCSECGALLFSHVSGRGDDFVPTAHCRVLTHPPSILEMFGEQSVVADANAIEPDLLDFRFHEQLPADRIRAVTKPA